MSYLAATIPRFFLEIVQHGMCEATPVNSLPAVMSSAARGGLLSQAATLGCYRLAPDEALIVTADPLGARYLGVQIADPWMVSYEYRRRTSSLNHLQAEADLDDRVRFVISTDDPGVPNWLDGSGAAAGAILLRWQKLPEGALFKDAVTTEVVKFKDLSRHLPKGTRRVGRASRLAQRDTRERGYRTRISG